MSFHLVDAESCGYSGVSGSDLADLRDLNEEGIGKKDKEEDPKKDNEKEQKEEVGKEDDKKDNEEDPKKDNKKGKGKSSSILLRDYGEEYYNGLVPRVGRKWWGWYHGVAWQ